MKDNMATKEKVQNNKGKVGMLVGVGSVAAGVSLILMNSNARTKVKDSSTQMKGTVSNYASTVKEDPKGTKDAIIDKVKRTTDITKDAVNKIQNILDNQGQEMKETAQDVVEQSKEVADQSKDVVDTAKDAQEELKGVGDDVKKAKDEVKPSGSKKKTNSASKETSHHVISEPIE
ncbi:hypothetical protein ACFOGI_05010 [Virgibacillus xinjiangensis]|uniref:Gas vesicle protein n=1 Tax=Virgibacillus xinjiangensis TaxID=393090 RepID=A0ABV7CTZ5_9BACI